MHTDNDIATKLLAYAAENFSDYTRHLGNEVFYGATQEFAGLLNLCEEAVSAISSSEPRRLICIMLPHGHGKSALARAMERAARADGFDTCQCFDGTRNVVANEVQNLLKDQTALLILDGLPTAQNARQQVLTRLIKGAAHVILLCAPVHAPDAALATFVSRYKTSHLDERSIDKLAIILGYAREAFAQGVADRDVDFSSLRRLPKDVLIALVATVRCGDKAAELPRIGERIGRLIATRLALGDAANVEIDEMITLFEPLIGTMPAGVGPRSYRLWVEGDTDLRLLQLAARLSSTDRPLLSGLEIGLIGTSGRGGGTSRLPETIARERTSPDWDLFLFDNDESGREAGTLIRKLGQRALILPLQLAASASEDNIEIEDLVSVECLDQFYEDEFNLSPESELLVYGTDERRRLVVRGIDKEQLVQWMQNNAKLDDVQNLVRLLKHVRWMFGLAYGEELPKGFMPSTLSERCRLGRRPKPWWYVASLTK